MHFSWRFSSFWQFSSVELDHVSIVVSSTNQIVDELSDESVGRSVLAKKRKRIGEREEPCGIPVFVGIWSPLNEPRAIVVVLSSKKDLIKLVIHIGIPFTFRLWRRRAWETLSNAPDISRLRADATCFVFPPQIV